METWTQDCWEKCMSSSRVAKSGRTATKLCHSNFQGRLYPYTAERRDVLDCTSPTTKRFPEPREMSWGRSQYIPSQGSSILINPFRGMHQEIHPCRAMSIGSSVKINTSLLTKRESFIFTLSVGCRCLFDLTINFASIKLSKKVKT